MPSRYARTRIVGLGTRYATSYAVPIIRQNIANGNIRYEEVIIQERERLDILAGKFYGDGRLYWVLAAASNVGWTNQVPPGTLIKVANLDDVFKFVG